MGPDSQFLQFISEIFEAAAPGANQYLITGKFSAKKANFRFPVLSNYDSISVAGVCGVASVPLYVRSCDIVIAHGMGPHGIVAFLSSPRSAKKIWSGWGFDYYGNDYDTDADLISPATHEFIKFNIDNNKQNSIFSETTTKIISYGRHKAAKITNYFSAPIPSEFKIFQNRYNNYSCSYAQINYGSVAETFAKGTTKNHGANILVGNSAHQTNNHIDILKLLSKHNLEKRKVIVPLSYGDVDYREKLITYGKNILGNSFVPLVDFIPLDEYNSIISSCNVVIMNHIRQQALGNIGTALYQGAHVFLNPASPVYRFFKERDALVHSIHDLESKLLPTVSLCDNKIARNRAVLEGFWGREKIKANVDFLLKKAGAR